MPCALLLAAMFLARAAGAQTQTAAPVFVPPPRSIADITAILDQEKPDAAKIAKQTAVAEEPPPPGLDPEDQIAFLVRRGDAAIDLGRNPQGLADLRKAVDLAKARDNDMNALINALIELWRAERRAGNFARGNALLQEAASDALASRQRMGVLFTAYRSLAYDAARQGEFDQANAFLAKLDDTLRQSANWKGINARAFQSWYRYFADFGHAEVLDLQGNFAQAEPLYRRAIDEARQAEKDAAGIAGDNAPPPHTYVTAADYVEAELASSLARHGRMLEGEVEARQALLDQLKLRGRYTIDSAAMVTMLGRIIGMQGRYPEAEKLARTAVDTYRTLGVVANGTVLVTAQSILASTLVAQERTKEALAIYQTFAQTLTKDDRIRLTLLDANLDYAIASMREGNPRAAVPVAALAVEQRQKLSGSTSYPAAEAQGVYAAALAASGDKAGAADAFRKSVPVMLAATRHNDNEVDDSSQGWQAIRLQFVLEAYLGVLATDGGAASAVEAFRIADAARGQTVQRALAAAAVRAKVDDPKLADLVRQDQDAARQVTALDAVEAAALALPSDQRDQAALDKARAEIQSLLAARAKMRQEIRQRFPDYAQLIDPRPATVEQVQQALTADEVLFSAYVGQQRTYLWAVPKSGPISFAVSPLSRAAIDGAVKALRKTLDPDAATAGDIPAFDVATSYKLYAGLLDPVKPGWQNAKTLLVSANGTLGQLPFALLATQNVTPAPDVAGQPLFTGYRAVPWLIRQVAVAQLPSVTSLTTLRAVPAAKTQRKPFLGFGDPWFSKKEEAQAIREQGTMLALQMAGGGLVEMRKAPVKLRSAPKTEGVNSADLAELPRLPDTAQEVTEVAQALKADPAKDVYLGMQANEQIVRTMKLDDRRVIMFATHGLVPGDLDGLNEPALALTAPEVAKVPGDGLLTVSKILGLRLNADWVVLSACNTASGNGAGAEAVSGLGLAFFYAGSRALLVSNWPVETSSARQLTTELFRREAATPGITRAEALRQAMLAVLDGPGMVDPITKKPVYSYAHPIFWAPFSLVGDSGA